MSEKGIILPDQTRPDQTRPDQTRPDQTRPDQTRPEGNCVLFAYKTEYIRDG